MVKDEAEDGPLPGEALGLRVALEGTVGLRQAVSLREQLSDALEMFDSVEVDAGKLVDTDVSIVQLLIAARKSAERRGSQLSLLAGPGDAIATTAVRAGLMEPGGAPRTPDEAFWLGGGAADGEAA